MHFSFPAEGSFIHLFAKIAYSFSQMLIWIPCRECFMFFILFFLLWLQNPCQNHFNSLNASGGGRKAIFKNVQVFPMWKYFYPWGMKDWWNIQSIAAGSLYKQLWSTERTSLKKNKEKRCNCHEYERNYGGTQKNILSNQFQYSPVNLISIWHEHVCVSYWKKQILQTQNL